MKYYVVMATWSGIDDTYTEEYTGAHHKTRAEARKEFWQARSDINYEDVYIKEVEHD